ncbi:MAG: 2-oxoacid:acceptor oxidoreductase family protein, partial [Rhodospirillaceae bacterium]
MSAPAARPLTVLIAALGGEGGGVLCNWLVDALEAKGLPVQATSIPGVAQRTGATTYYLEIWPEPWSALAGKTPVLALAATPGEVDVVVASELLEAGRCLSLGYVTPDRTTLIATKHRVFTTTEKIAMGDGRLDDAAILDAAQARAQRLVRLDMQAAATAAGAPISAVMLGAICGAGVLPLDDADFRAAVEREAKA